MLNLNIIMAYPAIDFSVGVDMHYTARKLACGKGDMFLSAPLLLMRGGVKEYAFFFFSPFIVLCMQPKRKRKENCRKKRLRRIYCVAEHAHGKGRLKLSLGRAARKKY